MMTIRPMRECDDHPVSRILCECCRLVAEADGFTPEQHARMLSERCQPKHMSGHRARFTCYVAEWNGSVAGFIAGSGGNVEELFVDPRRHRRGIATALFRELESDCQGSVLTVSTTGFGVPFYEAMGMHVTGRRRVTFGPLEGREVIQLEKKRPKAAETTS